MEPRDDRWTRNSFSMRRMQGWQAWTLLGIAILFVLIALAVL